MGMVGYRPVDLAGLAGILRRADWIGRGELYRAAKGGWAFRH
jgi:hypothetical protein